MQPPMTNYTERPKVVQLKHWPNEFELCFSFKSNKTNLVYRKHNKI